MLAAVREWSKGGAELAHLAEQAGTTVEAFSALGYAARRTGVDTAGLATGIRKMQVTIAAAARGMPQAGNALAYVGASLEQLARMRPEEQFKYLADRIAAIPNPTERAAAAVRLFGRAGTELLPLIMQGSAGIERFEQRARELGLVTSTESAQAALRFSRALADLQAVLKKCVMVIGSALAPDLEGLVEKITSVAVRVRQWVAENRGLIVTVFKVAGAIVLAGVGFSVLGRVLGICGRLPRGARRQQGHRHRHLGRAHRQRAGLGFDGGDPRRLGRTDCGRRAVPGRLRVGRGLGRSRRHGRERPGRSGHAQARRPPGDGR